MRISRADALTIGALTFLLLIAGAILVFPSYGIAVHEGAGAVLLFLLSGALWLDLRGDGRSAMTTWATLGSLAALVAAGALGGAIAGGVLPNSDAGLPGVALVGLGAVLVARIAAGRRREVPTEPAFSADERK